MKQSQLFGKTIKDIPKDITTRNHQLLYRAGFIRESVAGRYYFLPLGMRVHERIARIIEEEMDAAGAQRILTPTLHQMELWEETNRTNTTGFELMGVEDRRGGRFALGGTAEEMIVDLVRRFTISYRDLPFNIYQFSNKFRDELRAKGGLLRTREFIMKDAYSFHVDREDFEREYALMSETYARIFARVGLTAHRVAADNGYIGGDYCHEYIVDTEVGESVYYTTESGGYKAHEDVAAFELVAMNPDEEVRPMEVVAQPTWVETMEDNISHYGEPAWRYLKNVVYKNRVTEEIIIVTIRGDLDVNKTKVESILEMVEQLEPATEEDLASFGSRPGWVHAWGHEGVRYVGDASLYTVRNFIGGQKEAETDTRYVNYGRDFEHPVTADVAMVRAGLLAPGGAEELIERKGAEVGNIFQLGEHYSSRMQAVFADADEGKSLYYMGCYGIGLGRTMATVAEVHADENGLVWPASIAPFDVHVLDLQQSTQAEDVYALLSAAGLDVLLDDRDLRPGGKFADSDLIGIPWRVVVSARSLEAGGVEVKRRTEQTSSIVSLEELVDFIMAATK